MKTLNMNRHLSQLLTIFVAIFVIVAGVFMYAPSIGAQSVEDNKNEVCKSINNGQDCTAAQATTDKKLNGTLTFVIDILSLIGGVAAVVMIMVAGLKFMTSQGDAAQVASARNTILYAIIGLVIIALSQFIVRFVLVKVMAPKPQPPKTTSVLRVAVDKTFMV